MIIFSSKFDNPNIWGRSYSFFLTVSGRKAASQRGRYSYSTLKERLLLGKPIGEFGKSVFGEAFIAFLRVQNGLNILSLRQEKEQNPQVLPRLNTHTVT